MKTKRTCFTQKVREMARDLKEFGALDLASALGIQTYADVKRIRTVISELKKSGEFAAVARGRYRYAGTGNEGWSNTVSTRIYRAMHVRGSFCARKVAALCLADESYVRVVIRRLVGRGDLEKTGKVKNDSGSHEVFYRICHADEFYRKYVL